MGERAVKLIDAGIINRAVGIRDNKIVDFDLGGKLDDKLLAHDVALRYVIPALELLTKGLREYPFRDGVKG